MNVLLNYGLFLSMSDFGEIMEIGICCSSFGSVVIASSLPGGKMWKAVACGK